MPRQTGTSARTARVRKVSDAFRYAAEGERDSNPPVPLVPQTAKFNRNPPPNGKLFAESKTNFSSEAAAPRGRHSMEIREAKLTARPPNSLAFKASVKLQTPTREHRRKIDFRLRRQHRTVRCTTRKMRRSPYGCRLLLCSKDRRGGVRTPQRLWRLCLRQLVPTSARA